MSRKTRGLMSRGKFWMAFVIVLLMGRVFIGESFGDAKIGIFESSNDIGVGTLKGSVAYDSAGRTYKISGSGENMWFDHDAFRFVWKKMSGDAVISADVSFLGEGKNPHRKAVVIIRQSLEPDSAYVDVARHGEGLTSLQYRDAKGATTHEVQANIAIPLTAGEETRLTTARGLDDGPDYAPDASFIYFNSERTGQMQIWRLKPDGSGQEQTTSDEFNNWFAHPWPDGKWIVFYRAARTWWATRKTRM